MIITLPQPGAIQLGPELESKSFPLSGDLLLPPEAEISSPDGRGGILFHTTRMVEGRPYVVELGGTALVLRKEGDEVVGYGFPG
jgi:hypothetical protein